MVKTYLKDELPGRGVLTACLEETGEELVCLTTAVDLPVLSRMRRQFAVLASKGTTTNLSPDQALRKELQQPAVVVDRLFTCRVEEEVEHRHVPLVENRSLEEEAADQKSVV